LVHDSCRHRSATSKSSAEISTQGKPKLIVGIVVDQMRYDYLFKYGSKYSEKGFKRLMKKGSSAATQIIPMYLHTQLPVMPAFIPGLLRLETAS
jgi:predicted AlkP superfamily pyrophosphatase or phosphodiesterase